MAMNSIGKAIVSGLLSVIVYFGVQQGFKWFQDDGTADSVKNQIAALKADASKQHPNKDPVEGIHDAATENNKNILANAKTPDEKRILAAVMLVSFVEGQSRFRENVCSKIGVPMPKFRVAMEQSYSLAMSNARNILGNNISNVLETIDHAAPEAEKMTVLDLDYVAKERGISRNGACQFYEDNAAEIVTATHFEKQLPEAYKLLANAK